MTTLKIIGDEIKRPSSIIDVTTPEGRKILDKIFAEMSKNEKGITENNPSKLEDKTEPIILQPSGNLRFMTDKNEYKEIIKYLNKTFPTHQSDLSNKLKFDNNVMKGSNTYIAIGIDMYLKSINSEYRLATQLDLEQNLNLTTGTYNDSGLALRNLTGTNKEQAVYLFNQLKQRGISKKDFPIWLNLRGLNLDDNLNFNLTDETFYSTAECLNWVNETNFSKINNFGLPKEKDKSSNRKIWTSNNALSGVYLNRNGNLFSRGDILASSDGDGRVVLAKARSA